MVKAENSAVTLFENPKRSAEIIRAKCDAIDDDNLWSGMAIDLIQDVVSELEAFGAGSGSPSVQKATADCVGKIRYLVNDLRRRNELNFKANCVVQAVAWP